MDRVLVLAAIFAAIVVVSVIARVLSKRRHAISRIDPADLVDAADPTVAVVFTSPYCHGCRLWLDELSAAGHPAVAIDIGKRPDAAARYRINHTPRVAVVRAADGTVLREFDHYTPRQHDLDAIARLLSNA